MKKAIALILALVMVFALCACGSSAPAPAPEAPAAPAEAPAEETPAEEAPAEVKDTKVYEFNMSCHESATSGQAMAIEPWVKALDEASDGRIKVTVYYGAALAAPNEELAMVENGAIDLCWNTTTIISDRFKANNVMGLPMLTGYTESINGTKAIQDLYNECEAVHDEFDFIHLVALHATSLNPLSTSFEITKPEDLNGLRVRTTNPCCINFLENLGCVPTSFTVADSYENMSKHVVDGLLNDWTNMSANKIWEVAPYTCNISAGFATGFVAMNLDSYNSMSDEVRAIFDEVSADLGMALGEQFENNNVNGPSKSEEAGGKVYLPDDTTMAYMKEAAQKTWDWWVASMNEQGYDAQGLLDKALEVLARYN